jgi:hypothetical protein
MEGEAFDFQNVPEETLTQINTEAEELLETEVEVNVEPVTITELEKSTITISPRMLMELNWLIKDE